MSTIATGSSNINALMAGNAIAAANTAITTATQRLSTLKRINSSSDDPSGIGLASTLNAQILGFAQANRNINQGIAMTQIVDSSLSSIQTALSSMRTLALSSASAVSANTLAANQAAFTQYLAQINTITSQASYNGYNLLDGSLTTAPLQVGSNAGNSMTLNLPSTNTASLGMGSPLALSSVGSSTTALSQGDLVINGYAIGPSLASYDTLSYSGNAGSAIAKANAVNLQQGLTGVTATVGSTTVGGSAMSALPATAVTGTFTLNGKTLTVTLGSTTDYAVNRSSVIDVINQNSGLTGVTATDGGDATHGVILKAADGRNITLALGDANITSANTGLAAAGTYVGTYSLYSNQGNPITIGTTPGQNIKNSDFALGTYKANSAQFATKAPSPSALAPATLTSGDLVINGYSITGALTSDDSATLATTTSVTKASSAIATAAAINKSTGLTGVSAKANANVLVGNGFTTPVANASYSMYLNGTTFSLNLSTTSTAASIASDINTYSGSTGVVASDNGSGLTLTATDGRSISLGAPTALVATNMGLGGLGVTDGSNSAATAIGYVSSVTLSSTKPFTIASGNSGNTNFEKLGFKNGTYGGTTQNLKLTSADVSTNATASKALNIIDGAISQVSALQGYTGAMLNRLSYQGNLATSMGTTNTSAYNNLTSADTAAETTALAKAQIIQASATAMLAQANLSDQTVLNLLKYEFLSH
jgi:flagellin